MKKPPNQNPLLSMPRNEHGDIPGSIGDLCRRVGYDVRDLIMEGYTWDEIYTVARGERSLEDLLQRGPQSRKKRP
ncbi:MAG: hypothetical protein JXA21_12820 [Anaerolineae bacterium]|nr:hypothetical protein [Anaerolineae bacterium]